MKLSTFTRSDVRSINADIQAAIQTVAKRYGVSIEVGNARYSSTEINTKVKIAVVSGTTGVALTKEAKAYELFAPQNGITVKLGDTIAMRGKQFVIKGWNTRSPKYPILAEGTDGKTYKIPVLSLQYSKTYQF
jgi:hypothetical protein